MKKSNTSALKRVSFTMREEHIQMLSDLAEINLGASLSNEIRRLIYEEWNRQHDRLHKYGNATSVHPTQGTDIISV